MSHRPKGSRFAAVQFDLVPGLISRVSQAVGWRPIVVTIVSVAIGVLLQGLLDLLFRYEHPLALYFLVVIFAAWLGGAPAAAGATLLSFLVADRLFLESTRQLDLIEAALFLTAGLALAAFSHALQTAKRHAQEQSRWLRSTLDGIGEGVIATDGQGGIVFLNPTAEELTGWTNEAADRANVEEVVSLLDDERGTAVESSLVQALRSGQTVRPTQPFVLRGREGRETPIACQASPISNGRGRIEGGVLVFRDVSTERRASEERRRLEAIVLSSQDAIIGLDDCGRVRDWNPGAERLFGYSAASMVGRPLSLIEAPANTGRLCAALARVVRGQHVSDFELSVRRSDGREQTASLSVAPIAQRDGRIRGVSLIAHDITDRKQAESGMRESRERLRLALDAGRVGVWDWNIRQDIITWSERIYEFHGMTPGSFSGRMQDFQALIHPEDRPAVQSAVTRSIEENAPYEVEFRIVRPNGDIRWLTTTGQVLRDIEGRPLRMLGATVDTTERKQAEQQLLQADRRKDEFLAMLAHELRNPLAAITMAVELLKQSDPFDPEEYKWAVDVVDGQAKQLVGIIDDLLDVSRITRGKITLRKQRISLRQVVERAVETASPLIDEKHHHLEVRIDPRVELVADPTRLEQVLVNLLSNAAKYTEPGGRIWLNGDVDGLQAVVSVRDTGMGIAREVLPHIFDLFAQADQSLARSHGGLGIGLTLVHRLVALHDGTVLATSAGPGQGSEFRVRLPLAPPLLEEEDFRVPTSPVAVPIVVPRRVLIVDDNRDLARALAMLLKGQGHEIHQAHDGYEAVETAQSVLPDVVLLDIGLPGMNGYEVAQRLRDNPQLERALLIAISGYGQEQDRRKSRQAGFDYHLVKPVDSQVLTRLLGEPSTTFSLAQPTA